MIFHNLNSFALCKTMIFEACGPRYPWRANPANLDQSCA